MNALVTVPAWALPALFAAGGAYVLLGLAVLSDLSGRGRLPATLGDSVPGVLLLLVLWPLAGLLLYGWPRRRA